MYASEGATPEQEPQIKPSNLVMRGLFDLMYSGALLYVNY